MTSEPPDLCSFAFSKTELVYQPIYLCRTCQKKSSRVKSKTKTKSKENTTFCCCAGCAESCHQNHDVAFFAYGKAYCDCGSSGCKLLTKTCEDSKNSLPIKPYKSFAATHGLLQSQSQPGSGISSTQERQYIQSYNLEGLDVSALCDEAEELVMYTKDTFWLESSANPRCVLEALALRVLEHHCASTLRLHDCDCSAAPMESVGVEWWVQVKESALPTTTADPDSKPSMAEQESNQKSNSPSLDLSASKQNIGIDLHYDKDENVASLFSCGLFPALSTVTYLSDIPSLPTIVFDNAIADPIGKSIPSYALSYPRPGKHIVFEGHLLHGAPQALMGTIDEAPDSDEEEMKTEIQKCVEQNTHDLSHEGGLKSGHSSMDKIDTVSETLSSSMHVSKKRVTFLVNVWVNHRPSDVHPLPESILCKLLQPSSTASFSVEPSPVTLPQVHFQQEPVVPIHVLPTALDRFDRQWVTLPFVTQQSAWGKAEDEAGLVLKCWQPSHLLPRYCVTTQSYQLSGGHSNNGVETRKMSDLIGGISDLVVDFAGGTFHIIYPIDESVCGAVLEYEEQDGFEEEDIDDGDWEDVSDKSTGEGVVLI